MWNFDRGKKMKRGNGIGVDAVRAILYYAFYILNLRKIITYVADFNKRAFKVQEKVGKCYTEGCLKSHFYFNNGYADLFIRSFFREDYDSLSDEYSI